MYVLSAMMIGIWGGSWLTDLQAGIAGLLLGWLTSWVNVTAQGDMQAGVPFIYMGVLAGYWLIITHGCATWWVKGWLVLVAIVTLTEVDQSIRNRYFNWGDMSWGSLGAFSSMAVMGIIAVLIQSRERLV